MSDNFGWGSINSTVILPLTFLRLKNFSFLHVTILKFPDSVFMKYDLGEAPVEEFQTPQSSGKELLLISTFESFLTTK